jgi:outer membrane protein OmpA-like peptidoglycan-associated protein
MMKKILLIVVLVIALSYQSKAGGSIVGSEKITAVEEHHYSPNSRKEKPIVLTKPNLTAETIRLVPLEDFLSSNKRKSIVVSEKEYKGVSISENDSAKAEEERVAVEDIDKDDTIGQKTIADFIKASEIYISYDSDKKTLLSSSAKESLKEIALKSKEEDAVIGIISYAAGEPSMARRVALLRANIIKNTLKSYGVHEGKVDVQSFGNQININQSRAFLVR